MINIIKKVLYCINIVYLNCRCVYVSSRSERSLVFMFFYFKGYPKPHLYNFLRNTASEQDLSEYGALICMSRERGKRTIM